MPESQLPRIGFIGAGRMATAMVQGLIRSKITSPDRIIASDVVEEAREALADITKVKVYAENKPVVEHCDVVFLAVKPQVMAEVLLELKPLLDWQTSGGLGGRWRHLDPARSSAGQQGSPGSGDAEHANPGRRRGNGVLPGSEGDV